MTHIDETPACRLFLQARGACPGRDRHSLTMLSRTTPTDRTSILNRRDRFRDPSLTALLIIQICLIFVVAPLVAQGLPMAQEVGEALLLVAASIVVLLSRSRAAIVIIRSASQLSRPSYCSPQNYLGFRRPC